MPQEHQNRGTYATNGSGSTYNHGQAVAEDNSTGVAVKQKAVPWTQGYVNPHTIADGEEFYMITKGIALIPAISGAVRGSAVYINSTTSAIASASGGGLVPFGRVVEVAGQRGCPTGKCRVDMDAKDSI